MSDMQRRRENKMKRCDRVPARLFIIMVCFALAFTVIPVLTGTGEANAAGRTKKMTVYDEVLKSGNYAYCVTDGPLDSGLYRVDLRTSEVKCLMKYAYGEGGSTGSMSLKKGYLYYTISDDMFRGLYRVKTTGGAKKRIGKLSGSNKYAISGSTIYYTAFHRNVFSPGVMKKMKLSGKNKRNAKGCKVKMTRKKTNNNGYKIVKVMAEKTYDYDALEPDSELVAVDIIYNCYLQKPDGSTVFLGTLKDVDFEPR